MPLNFTKSINLALSERGINAMRPVQHYLIDEIMKETIPMHGRMIHGKDKNGNFTQTSQIYDVHGRHINAVDRAQLNRRLLDALDDMPNVKFFFNHKLTGADFKTKRAWFEIHDKPPEKPATALNRNRYSELEVQFDLMIGADGAHSAARYHLMKFARLTYEQTYIDTLWCEFHASPRTPASGEPEFALNENHLHIWPGSTQMFIAIPSLDRSFTCTLFAPDSVFTTLRRAADPERALVEYFQSNFPGVTPDLIPEKDLVTQFQGNPALPLISIKCTPYHFQDAGVILGDAAHAMVPFYGQGMNTGLEDVRVLFECLDAAGVYPNFNDARATRIKCREAARGKALEEYTRIRTPDAAAINDLALGNYYEMRAGVVNPLYKARKKLEEFVSDWMPWTGWATQYARVSFTNERYSEVDAAVQRQERVEIMGVIGLVGVMSVGALGAWMRWRR